jgi:hypothetical protein
MPAPLSLDLRQRIMSADQTEEGSQRQLAKRFKVSLSFIRDLVRRYRETNTIEPKPHVGGAVAKLEPKHLQPQPLQGHRDSRVRASEERRNCFSLDQQSSKPTSITLLKANDFCPVSERSRTVAFFSPVDKTFELIQTSPSLGN